MTIKKIKVALYLRMSSKQQDLSIDDQRIKCREYCESRGYEVVEEFRDEGKSASKDPTGKEAEKITRPDFARMLAAAIKAEWKVIVCWDLSRFSRMDPIDSSPHKQILRNAGVSLDTVKEGTFEWATSEGRMKDTMYCEANHRMSMNVSRDSLRGRENILRLGYWPAGVVPYGYDRVYTDGIRTVNIGRREKYKKGRDWHLKLVINEAEAAIVKEIFTRITTTDISFRGLGMELTKRNVLPPDNMARRSQGNWDKDSIKGIVKNKAYMGTASIGRGRKIDAVKFHNRAKLVEIPDSCPAIVDKTTWEEAQLVLAEKSKANRRPKWNQSGTLSGILICGKCGYRLAKKYFPKDGRIFYTCDSATKKPHLGCRQWRVYEDEILEDLLCWVDESIDSEVIERLAGKTGKPGEAPDDRSLLVKQIEALAKQFDRETTSALGAPAIAQKLAWEKVGETKAKLDALTEQLAVLDHIRGTPALKDFAAYWEMVRSQLSSRVVVVAGKTGEGELLPVELVADAAVAKRVAKLAKGQKLPAVVYVPKEMDLGDQWNWTRAGCDLDPLIFAHGDRQEAVYNAPLQAEVRANGEVRMMGFVRPVQQKEIAIPTMELRSLLLRLGVTVTLWWSEDKEARKHNRRARAFSICKQELAVKVGLKPQYAMVGGSNKYSRVRSPDKG